MLKISKLSDYSLRLLRILSGERRLMSASLLSTATGLGIPTVRKLLKRLSQAGIILSEMGFKGGYRLHQPLSTITLADVLRAIDGPLELTACVNQSGWCAYQSCCNLQAPWHMVNEKINDLLAGISLDEMFAQTSTPRGVLVEDMVREHRSKRGNTHE